MENFLIGKIHGGSLENIIIEVPRAVYSSILDAKQGHSLYFTARFFEEAVRDSLSGFFGTNTPQRTGLLSCLSFHLVPPNTVLVEEGQSESESAFIVLKGAIDIRKRMPSKEDERRLVTPGILRAS